MTEKLMKKIWVDDEWLRKTDLFHNDFDVYCAWMNTPGAMDDRLKEKRDKGITPAAVCDWHGYNILTKYFGDDLYKNKEKAI